MKASELRIGNRYLSTKFQSPVICEMGDFGEIYARADGSSEYDVDEIFQPLPLTEEWLLKFGFERYQDAYYYPYKKMFLCIQLPPNYAVGLCRKEDWAFYDRFEHVEYVHQLQNLYFALTNEEL